MQLGTPEFSATISMIAALIAAISAATALLSVFITRKNWKDSNRPVVTVYIDQESRTTGITLFNLYMTNTGTRPATAVQLFAKKSDISKLISNDAKPTRKKYIQDIFTAENQVMLLKPDETLVSSFGLSSIDPSQQWLEYGIEILVTIQYSDTEGRKYRTKIPLRTRPRTGFGGGLWQ